MEKNKEKSHLIDQLYDYLEEQIQELKTDRNQLNHKMQDMIQEKNEKEGAISNQKKIYQVYISIITCSVIDYIFKTTFISWSPWLFFKRFFLIFQCTFFV